VPQDESTPLGENASWTDCLADENFDTPATPVPVPEALRHLARKGMQFQKVHFWGLLDENPKLVKNQSIYFSVDTIITSQEIL